MHIKVTERVIEVIICLTRIRYVQDAA